MGESPKEGKDAQKTEFRGHHTYFPSPQALWLGFSRATVLRMTEEGEDVKKSVWFSPNCEFPGFRGFLPLGETKCLAQRRREQSAMLSFSPPLRLRARFSFGVSPAEGPGPQSPCTA